MQFVDIIANLPSTKRKAPIDQMTSTFFTDILSSLSCPHEPHDSSDLSSCNNDHTQSIFKQNMNILIYKTCI